MGFKPNLLGPGRYLLIFKELISLSHVISWWAFAPTKRRSVTESFLFCVMHA
jgi:hypothetical protein